MYLPRLRRLNDVLKEIKKADPNTTLTYYTLRDLLRTNELTYLTYGNAYAINLDELYTYLKQPTNKHGCSNKEGNLWNL